MREAFRLNRHGMPNNIDLIVRPKRDAVGSYEAIASSMKKLSIQLDRRLSKLR